MIIKFLVAFILLTSLSCKKQPETINKDVKTADKSQVITEKDIAKFRYSDFGLDEKVSLLIESWQEYSDLEKIILNVKAGDLSYFKNDAKKNLKTLLGDLRETIPDTIKTPSVLARITAIETKLYKTESLSNLSTTKREELESTLKELLVSFSNLNFQMNKKLESDFHSNQNPE
jgi:hypothetical protein